jgi:hypothetical protein
LLEHAVQRIVRIWRSPPHRRSLAAPGRGRGAHTQARHRQLRSSPQGCLAAVSWMSGSGLQSHARAAERAWARRAAPAARGTSDARMYGPRRARRGAGDDGVNNWRERRFFTNNSAQLDYSPTHGASNRLPLAADWTRRMMRSLREQEIRMLSLAAFSCSPASQ